ncbi:hypothetical protein [Sedimentibacter sp. B4]|uniref:hypothetical protein n=1 Tax=Sedimentibacter sp. B4 TaxID=304766 RepID=UPI0002F4A48A|nr:hypothetical protein [Sedimentibacter sp. B4]
MTIEQIIEMQKKFDSEHAGKFSWDKKITDENIENLEYLLLCMIGEFGESSNLVKKVIRGDCNLNEIRENLSEEIIDIFIYVIKLIYQLDINLEEKYIEKLNKNKLRFTKYEKQVGESHE